MLINFDNLSFGYKGLIKKIYHQALRETGNNVEGVEVSIAFIDEDEIKKLNIQHRNVNKVTDVLSFPMLDIIYPQTLKDYEIEKMPNGNLYIGDIVICKQVAKRQAKEYGHSLKREVSFLALHGLLHLLGYDHIKKSDEKIMMKKSEEILNSLKIKRGKNV